MIVSDDGYIFKLSFFIEIMLLSRKGSVFQYIQWFISLT